MTEAPAPIVSGTVPDRRLDSRIRNLGDRLLVGRSSSALELDPTAGFVWRRIDGERTVRQLAELLAAEFGADPATALEDVIGLVGQLRDCGVVTLVTPPPAAAEADGSGPPGSPS
jgi:Coenzyme PQQ synthesis protein D (PqqD)